MKTQWMVITPDTAKRWVESNNTNNRINALREMLSRAF